MTNSQTTTTIVGRGIANCCSENKRFGTLYLVQIPDPRIGKNWGAIEKLKEGGSGLGKRKPKGVANYKFYGN